MLITCNLITAQKVFSVEYFNQTNVKVFVIKYVSQADLNILSLNMKAWRDGERRRNCN